MLNGQEKVVPFRRHDPRPLERRLPRDPYDMIVLSRRTLLDAQSPSEPSPLARELMSWRVSLLVY